MIDRVVLLADLRKQVVAAEKDLTEQVEHPVTELARAARDKLLDEYQEAKKVGRTAATWSTWLVGDDKFPGRIPQVAAAWVLGTVFVRFCEDNQLITEPYLTGPSNDRRDLAQVRYDAYVESDPDPTYRGWLLRAFAEVGSGQAGKLLFDPTHNALYQIPLSHEGAGALVEFWRAREELGKLVHDFTDPLRDGGKEGWSTRFLGDLYQDLSENARKAYALLQTPVFVEEFILDRTMKPALGEFGHEELKVIDPTCGSGHFVLGAFRRLVKAWEVQPHGKDLHRQVRAALDSVHGVDLNPFAVAIARFRLLVAAMAAARVETLAKAANYEWPIHLAVGDSLIQNRQLELDYSYVGGGDSLTDFSYATEDLPEHSRILENGRYHVVVGNPPYITVKDKKLSEGYRKIYSDVCSGKYALSVPFAARFFELAKGGDSDGRGFGRVGQITANSFMKREFGVKLIEKYFAEKVALTEVIDTSGAYIPGHGTPTVILVGTPRSGTVRMPTIRTVRSVQGEPKAPAEPENGLVWREIVEQIDNPGFVGQWVSVDDLDRKRYFGKHPWVLADGGLEMMEMIHHSSDSIVQQDISRIGFYGVMGSDDAMTAHHRVFSRFRAEDQFVRRLIVGDEVRDYSFKDGDYAFHPYDVHRELHELSDLPTLERYIWPMRTELGSRATFSRGTYFSDGRPWYEWHQIPKDRGASRWSITFAFVATHNHFVLDRGGKVFNRSAPVIKLPEGASEEEHLRLLGLLNSAAACFWLKMVSHDKGRPGADSAGADEPWEHRFEFTGTKLEEFPLPSRVDSSLAFELDELSRQLTEISPDGIAAASTPITNDVLKSARLRWESLRGKMIALQEEIDWQVYATYRLLDESITVEGEEFSELPELESSQRAFAIVLADKRTRGEVSTTWFEHHNHKFTPTTEIPSDWPDSYKRIVERRIKAIGNNRAINMIERPEYKRRWATESWDSLQHQALRSWLLDRMEHSDLWHDENDQPIVRTLPRLTDLLSQDEDFTSVAAIYAPRHDLAKVVADLLTKEHVPFLAALRYKPSGLRKRADWEHVWDLQRQEDNASNLEQQLKIRDSIPVPPKYTSTDFLRTSFWQARGKLDVPKERFISYGDTNTPTPQRYGWAGWDHREQAQALATYFTTHALDTEQITPLLAGLLEIQPWLHQWHNEFDDAYSGPPSEFFAGYRRQVQSEHGLTDDDLRAWRPPAATRGRAVGARKTTRARTTKE